MSHYRYTIRRTMMFMRRSSHLVYVTATSDQEAMDKTAALNDRGNDYEIEIVSVEETR